MLGHFVEAKWKLSQIKHKFRGDPMDPMSIPHEGHNGKPRFAKFVDWYRIGTWGAIAIMAFYLLSEHTAHVLGALPCLFILACPLMHFFMHGSHGGHHQHGQKENK
jgi:hypothetical protein